MPSFSAAANIAGPSRSLAPIRLISGISASIRRRVSTPNLPAKYKKLIDQIGHFRPTACSI